MLLKENHSSIYNKTLKYARNAHSVTQSPFIRFGISSPIHHTPYTFVSSRAHMALAFCHRNVKELSNEAGAFSHNLSSMYSHQSCPCRQINKPQMPITIFLLTMLYYKRDATLFKAHLFQLHHSWVALALTGRKCSHSCLKENKQTISIVCLNEEKIICYQLELGK